MACRTSIERRVWAVAVALGLSVVAPAVEAQQVVKIAAGVPLTGPLSKQGQRHTETSDPTPPHSR